MRGNRTEREHLTAHWKATGKKPKALVRHGACPEGFEAVMDSFRRLSRQRRRSMGIEPITHLDIDAFQRLEGTSLRPWQVQAIEQIDALWRAEQT